MTSARAHTAWGELLAAIRTHSSSPKGAIEKSVRDVLFYRFARSLDLDHGLDLNSEQWVRFMAVAVPAALRGDAFDDIKPLAFETQVAKDLAVAPSTDLTHAQNVLRVRFQVFVVVFFALYGLISANENQADKLTLYTGGGAVPIAWYCATLVAKEYDKRYGPDRDAD
ncbi:hypothetical protein [Nonomuraea cavernae]|uniref:Uncharacterized protein n=1 Tax=Nonomuraea cavernae TaxID=2045107 RepID=A0A917YQN5_9ACTN|nr:hypothetical protein [Nonomuraea cavernae]MCA2184614.1 hypothetical protein [Nonomuraea cavernae]GGO63264.1 hypothetical protein GCM10012289_09870 [Nonomuraea cavernae]